MIESYDPATRAWAEREQADEERRRLERAEREGQPDPDADIDWAESARNQLQGMRDEAMRDAAACADDIKPREPGCGCHLEEGDSPCVVHGLYEAESPSDPDADRPCSCEESEQLKAAVLELQNQLMATASEKERWRLLHDEQSLAKSLAVQRAVTAESDANVNRLERERLEARVRELEATLKRQVELYLESQDQWHRRQDNWRESSESEARVLRERIERAIRTLESTHAPRHNEHVREALEALRGS